MFKVRRLTMIRDMMMVQLPGGKECGIFSGKLKVMLTSVPQKKCVKLTIRPVKSNQASVGYRSFNVILFVIIKHNYYNIY